MGRLYRVTAPLATHWRGASCREIDCDHYLNGWQVRVETTPGALIHTATHCGRKFTRVEVAEGETYLVFEAGQSCFQAGIHKVPVGRPELYLVRNRGDQRRFDRPDQWVDDFATHVDKIEQIRKEG